MRASERHAKEKLAKSEFNRDDVTGKMRSALQMSILVAKRHLLAGYRVYNDDGDQQDLSLFHLDYAEALVEDMFDRWAPPKGETVSAYTHFCPQCGHRFGWQQKCVPCGGVMSKPLAPGLFTIDQSKPDPDVTYVAYYEEDGSGLQGIVRYDDLQRLNASGSRPSKVVRCETKGTTTLKRLCFHRTHLGYWEDPE